MSITAYQINNGMPTPISDRMMYNLASGGVTGILSGCTFTKIGERIRVDDGWAIIQGCIIRVKQEQVEVELAPSGSTTVINGRLSIKLDVSTPSIEFYSEAAATLPTIGSSSYPQESINATGNVYIMPLCTYKVNGVQITSDLTDVSPKVTISSVAALSTDVATIQGDITTINSSFNTLKGRVDTIEPYAKQAVETGTANQRKKLEMTLSDNNTVLTIRYTNL